MRKILTTTCFFSLLWLVACRQEAAIQTDSTQTPAENNYAIVDNGSSIQHLDQLDKFIKRMNTNTPSKVTIYKLNENKKSIHTLTYSSAGLVYTVAKQHNENSQKQQVTQTQCETVQRRSEGKALVYAIYHCDGINEQEVLRQELP
ncbi:DUF4362 domain-containing protein [Aureibacillus halotolerans]|uniref:Uncharacterized protein DUF4362 n=1 Tax=Aureibacillus halotolerans TaxID=1508390 RepID=A0A4R6UA36_9BACI|nr:DUF4362 domain-containing protein [Aureibacillus halotolerans]TDQ42702.1 uncharacterized protein DUF4362 [Aureibacillus halotolerans]